MSRSARRRQAEDGRLDPHRLGGLVSTLAVATMAAATEADLTITVVVGGGPPIVVEPEGTRIGPGRFTYFETLFEPQAIIKFELNAADGSGGIAAPREIGGSIQVQRTSPGPGQLPVVVRLTQTVVEPTGRSAVALSSVGGSTTAANVPGVLGNVIGSPGFVARLDEREVFVAYEAIMVATQPYQSVALDPDCSVDPNDLYVPPAKTVELEFAVSLPVGQQAGFSALLLVPDARLPDIDGDGVVGGADLGLLLGQWGGPGSADLNYDGVVDGADLGLLLGAWTTDA